MLDRKYIDIVRCYVGLLTSLEIRQGGEPPYIIDLITALRDYKP